MKKQDLFAKLQVAKVEELKKLGITREEIDYIKDKLLNDKLGLKLNFSEVDNEEKANYILLEEIEELGVCRNKERENNLLIEGDNYHALKALKTAEFKVDAIYIDPPYNTGNKDFMYNDDFGIPKYVNSDDPHKHSKWLCFMKRRLELSKEILNKDGIIFISIDDNEQAYLKVLMDEIFGENSFIGCSSRKTLTNNTNESGFCREMDYILVYSNTDKTTLKGVKYVIDQDQYEFCDEHVKERGNYLLKHPIDKKDYQKNLDFKVCINGKTFVPGGDLKRFNERKIKSKKSDYRWTWSRDTIDWGIENNLIEVKGTRIYKKQYSKVSVDASRKSIAPKVSVKSMSSLKFISNVYSNEVGTKEMVSIFGEKVFDYPKPSVLIKDILKFLPKDVIVLDFFGGSGTTGQAVMELNEEDGGNRRFILCTNNEMEGIDTIEHPEEGIARSICRERIHRVIKGEDSRGKDITWNYSKSIKCLSGNSLSYLKIKLLDKYNGDFEDIDKVKKMYKREFNRNISIRDLKE